ncbi:class I SAM-dependent methyltransferase [Salinifilum ghardaiensis]
MTIAGRIRAFKGRTSPTAELCAVVRAAETRRPRGSRLLNDPHARYFLHNWRFRFAHAFGALGFGVSRADKRYTGLLAEIVLRHRHCDEVIAAELAGGCRQVVVLGAGYDTTALRNDFACGTVVHEVDKPDTQAEKIGILRRNGLRPKQSVRYVSCDFDAGDDLAERLLSSGFDPDGPCVVLWMGVTYYLSREGVLSTLAKLGRVSAPGSTLVLDYIDRSVVDGSHAHDGAQRGKELVASGGEPFTFGLDRADVDPFFTTGGFAVDQHHSVPGLLEIYGDTNDFWLTTADFMGVLTLRRTGGAG